MKLHTISINTSVITLSNGTRVMFSYDTPVAAYVPGIGYMRTATHFSKTTSKHINEWLSGAEHTVVQQQEIERLLP
jgi:hypothetical protein